MKGGRRVTAKEAEDIVARQRAFFGSGTTKRLDFRLTALCRLRSAMLANKENLLRALKKDLGKARTEGYMTEFGLALSELSHTQRNLRSWARPQKLRTSVAQLPGRVRRISEPYGVTLIMSPWNYPLLLTIEPLIGAIAAGNCAVLKPSNHAPATSAAIGKLIADAFPPKYITVVEGGREENQALLEQRFDYIFFTGGVTVGKLVMEKAAAHLTPVTLELGGKSPCIVDKSANLNLAAKRIVFGKYLNSGQTCVAPDYLLVDEAVKDELVHLIRYWIRRTLGEKPLESPDYSRMVERKHYDRVMGLIQGQKVLEGGYGRPSTLQIAPTVLDNVSPDAPVMQEEIFGPVLPVLTYKSLDEAERFVAGREKPLALYLFSEDAAVCRRILRNLSFGGGCVNDTVLHMASPYAPFGGVGQSGMGSYHGEKSFETFSHCKSVLLQNSRLDIPLRYRPYTGLQRFLLELVLR